MNKKTSSVFPWLVIALFCLAYVFWKHLGIPTLRFAPATGEFHWAKPEGLITIGWYGRLLGSAALGLILGLVTAPLLDRLPEKVRGALPWLAAVTVLLCMVHLAWYEVNRWILDK